MNFHAQIGGSRGTVYALRDCGQVRRIFGGTVLYSDSCHVIV